MAYIGNIPAESFASFEKQVFTIVNSQTAYTLSHSVTNENDIRLVVNSVVQEPGSGKAYTASGTTLTLSAALTNGTDTMYCVFLGRALQTVNPPNASVGTAQLGSSLDFSSKTITLASNMKNTPAFEATITTEQNPSASTETKINFDNEVFDTDSAYDTTNKRFTVPSGQAGKYHFYCDACMGSNTNSDLNTCQTFIYKNGSKTTTRTLFNSNNDGNGRYMQLSLSTTIDLAVGDYIEIFGNVDLDSGTVEVRTSESRFGGYKIIE